MTWAELIEWGASELVTSGVEEAHTNAEYLALHALGLWDRRDLRRNLTADARDEVAFRAYIARRATREPLQYILGEWEFFGLRLYCSSAALIPRPETEILVEEALVEAKNFTAPGGSSPRILDIGTGTGAIALALASRLPSAHAIGVDVSMEALQLAEKNRKSLELRNVRYHLADILSDDLAEYHGSVDLLVSNPPYVSLDDYAAIEPELLHEPRVAITDGANGMAFYERIIDLSNSLLKPGAVLLLEMGYNVQQQVASLVTSAGLSIDRVVPDLSRIERVLVARKPV
jgi:release factor glutamine methyltransferase